MDHYGKVSRKTNPREKANILSLISFAYTGGLFRKGIKRDLEEEDIYEVVDVCKSDKNAKKFEKEWMKAREHSEKTSLVPLVWKCFGLKFMLLGTIQLTWKVISSIYEPEAIGKLVSYFNPNQTRLTFDDAVFYAGLMIGLKFIHALYMQNYHIYLQQVGIQMRTSLCSLVYRKEKFYSGKEQNNIKNISNWYYLPSNPSKSFKECQGVWRQLFVLGVVIPVIVGELAATLTNVRALKMTPAAMNEMSLGNIITVITKDVPGFEMFVVLMSELWIDGVKIILTCYLIYNKMGPAGLVGVGFLVGVLPIQIYFGKLVKNLRLNLNKKTDERLQITQETLSAIKIIKMYTWETIFAKRVEEKRVKEMKYLMKAAYLKSVNFILGIFTSKIGLYLLVITYIATTEYADAEVIFYVMRCFNDLRRSLGIMIPIALGRGAEMLASCQRINRILNCEELDKTQTSEYDKPKVKASGVSVKVKGQDILRNITTELKPGLTVITGPLGCGKTTLLKLFLKDFPVTEGKILSQGTFSYSSQDPWLFPSSIKQNIIFGERLDEVRYQKVVKVCALEYDFNLFDHGDETIVADGGKNLSGGQQARINLARAIYRKSEIYLLDDPLHALDPHVQEYVYKNCIKDFLKDKMVAMVTHNLKHKNGADNLIVMKDAEIKFDGKPTEVKSEILKEIEIAEEEMKKEKENEDDDSGENTKLIKEAGVGRKKVYKEIKKQGKVDMAVYKKYFAFGGGMVMFSLLASMFVVSEVSESYSSRQLTNWINIQQNITNIKLMNHTAANSTVFIEMNNQANWILKLYSGLIVSSFIMDLIKQLCMLNFFRKASINIHNTMIERLTTAGMVFYDNYFIGNILNRFSQDLNVIDEHLPSNLNMFIMVVFACAGIITLVSTVSYTFLIPAGVLVIVLYSLRTIYMPTGRSLKRLEAATRSPLIGHLNSTLEGVTTIRASKAEKILIDEFDRHQDLYISASYMMLVIRRAFAFFMDMMSATFLTVIVGKFMFFGSGEVSGDVGLAITKAAALAAMVQWGLIQWSDLENDMTSVERVLEYTEVPQDKYEGTSLDNWPTHAAVEFRGVSLTYKLEKVLKNVSFEVKSKYKIGIVGRTGAGKSSIISALFRLYNYEGKILIDGVDIKTLSLEFLRNHISIIPQDPLLFQGSIRQNIDPLNQYTDDEIWVTLEKVHMRDHIHSLELTITEHGSNFSTGQRQLICLARAIIKKNKIVVLDEATANMDPDTEFLVQKAIVDNFANCTLFIIAHRLQSVLDCNKILVMEKGEVVEYADPLVLMENKNSFFAKMLDSDNAHVFGK